MKGSNWRVANSPKIALWVLSSCQYAVISLGHILADVCLLVWLVKGKLLSKSKGNPNLTNKGSCLLQYATNNISQASGFNCE